MSSCIYVSLYPCILLSLYPCIRVFLYPYIIVSLYPVSSILFPVSSILYLCIILVSWYSSILVSRCPSISVFLYPGILVYWYPSIRISRCPSILYSLLRISESKILQKTPLWNYSTVLNIYIELSFNFLNIQKKKNISVRYPNYLSILLKKKYLSIIS